MIINIAVMRLNFFTRSSSFPDRDFAIRCGLLL